mmetsp:Transcript_74295/g.177008  ORF Transcript_74295/g.177008 Transcript_74295/m.177008 type:complete len:97 (+) Transcript_74295:460-750(+)
MSASTVVKRYRSKALRPGKNKESSVASKGYCTDVKPWAPKGTSSCQQYLAPLAGVGTRGGQLILCNGISQLLGFHGRKAVALKEHPLLGILVAAHA